MTRTASQARRFTRSATPHPKHTRWIPYGIALGRRHIMLVDHIEFYTPRTLPSSSSGNRHSGLARLQMCVHRALAAPARRSPSLGRSLSAVCRRVIALPDPLHPATCDPATQCSGIAKQKSVSVSMFVRVALGGLVAMRSALRLAGMMLSLQWQAGRGPAHHRDESKRQNIASR